MRETIVRAAIGAGLAVALIVTAHPASAQSSSQQAGRPQPPPAPAAAPQAAGSTPATTAAPQTAGGTKPAGTPQAAKPTPAGPQTTGAKAARPKPAPPRTSPAWKGRGFVVLSGGAQVAAPDYTSTAVFKLNAEDATLNADAKVGVGPVFGARGGMRVWKNMALGGGVEVASTSQSLDVTARLPHPFMFNQYRDVAGTASGLSRVETLAAFEVSWLVALARRLDMFVFGGPAYIHIQQDMATRVQFTESYPYDTVKFVGVETASMTGGGVGATAGIDVSYLLTRQLGIGGEVRYSYASTTLRPAGEPAKVGLGGLQVAFAARILF